MIALGADRILMTKGATLGPIDSTISGDLNPCPKPSEGPVPVEVESIAAYLDIAHEKFAIKEDNSLADILNHLAGHVHPLVIGNAYREIKQSKMVADKLLSISHKSMDEKKKENLINFLVSESGNHSYTINRKEAKELGLEIEAPDDKFYNQIKELYDSIFKQLKTKIDQDNKITTYHPILIESVNHGADMSFAEVEREEGKIHVKEGWYRQSPIK